MIDVAIFGAGRIGKIHAGNIVGQPGVRLKYVVDRHHGGPLRQSRKRRDKALRP